MHKFSYALFHEKSELHASWLQLGDFDPTRQSVEHEQALVRYLLSLGGTLGLVLEDRRPRFRCLFCPVDEKKGIHSLGFMAASEPGFYEAPQPAFEGMLRDLGERHAIQKVVGPINGLTWFNYRLRTDEDPRTFAWEPVRQAGLERFLRAHHFETEAHYHSTCTRGLRKFISETASDWTRVRDKGISIVRLLPERMTPAQFREIHELSLAGFSSNHLFSPLSFEAFAGLYLAGKSDATSYLMVATDDKGKTIAYALGFLEGRRLVYKTATTDPAYRKQGISNALFHAMGREVPADVEDVYISALVFKGLASESYARHGETIWEHQYLLLSRSLHTGRLHQEI